MYHAFHKFVGHSESIRQAGALSLRGSLVAFLLFFAACSDIGERDNPLDPGASNYVASDTTNVDDNGDSSGSHDKASSSSNSNDAKSSAASFSSGEIVCGDLWCGPKGDFRVETEFEDSDSYGFWFDYNDNNDTDDKGFGTSFFTWPAEWGEDHAWNNIIEYCGGVCGSVTMGGPLAYPFAGIGFDISRSDKVGNDITGWGGLCVAYMSDGIDIAMEIEPVNSKDLTAYDNHKVTLKVRDTIGVVDYPWSKFKQAGWGKTADLNAVLSSAIRVKFQFNGSDGEKSNFKIVSVGRYGTCNEVVNQSSNSGDVINVTSSSSVSSSSQKTTSSSSVFNIEVYLNPNISYGEITDERDNQVYKTVVIGELNWMAQNLNFETKGSYCYSDKSENCAKFGRLYTWGAAMDSSGTYNENGKGCGYGTECTPNYTQHIRGVCPAGWHIPTMTELASVIGHQDIEKDAKARSQAWPTAQKTAATNETGFSLVQSGYRNHKGDYADGNNAVYLWSSTLYSSSIKYRAMMYSTDGGGFEYADQGKHYSLSIRCVQDYEVLGTMVDERDGQSYKTVKIGGKNWMAQNLNYAYLEPTKTEDSSSYCYDNLPSNCETYGRVYMWSAAMDSVGKLSETGKNCGDKEICSPTYPVQGVCPKDWHLPTQEEYDMLILEIGGNQADVKVLKTTSGWAESSNGSDNFGFSALPAGEKGLLGYVDDGRDFQGQGTMTGFWTSTEEDDGGAITFSFSTNKEDKQDWWILTTTDVKTQGKSVRCVENDK